MRATKDAQRAPKRSLRAGNEAVTKDWWFNPYLISNHLFVTAMTDNIVMSYELLWGTKQRKAKQRDKETLKRILHSVVANLAFVAAEGRNPASFLVSLRAAHQKLTRYDARGFNRLPEILHELNDKMGDFVLHKAAMKGEASSFTAPEGFRETMCRFRIRPGDFEIAEGRETIWLARTSRNHYDSVVERELIDYEDTAQSVRYRAEMATINAVLRKADIGFLASDGREASPLLTLSRELRRHFILRSDEGDAPRFDRSGRLFGGWWQTIPSSERKSIRLDGEPIADLDFAQMFLRLAYLEAGVEPPAGDLYADLPGRLGEARWRPGIKEVVNTLFFREGPLQRLPRGSREHLPPETTAAHIRSVILSRHPKIEPLFESGRGLHLMFLESQILVAALLRLEREGLTAALPMHDGIMVPKSRRELAERAMREASEQIVGFPLPIALKDK